MTNDFDIASTLSGLAKLAAFHLRTPSSPTISHQAVAAERWAFTTSDRPLAQHWGSPLGLPSLLRSVGAMHLSCSAPPASSR